MKKFFALFIAALICSVLVAAVSAADVYVNDGGTGDGSSAASPLGSMDEAINKIADGGRVIIVDTYTCADEYHEPNHNGDIVISGGKYVFMNGSYNRWFLEGPGATTFENITFEYGAGSTNLIIGQFHKLVIGEGVVFPNPGKCYVIGGYQSPTGEEDVTLESDVTVKSGNIWCVAALNRGAGTVEWLGTGHVTVEGGEIATVYGANVNGNYGTDSVINIKGGTIENVRAAGEITRRLNGNSVINITGGMIGMLTINNVMGTATVNYTGGTIGGAEKTVEAAIEEFVVDGSATLNTTPDMNAKMLALFFDNVNYNGAADPVVTEAPVIATEATTVATEATTVATEATTVATEATTVATEATTVATEATTVATEATTVATEATTVATEATTAASEETTAASADSSTAPVATEPAEETTAAATEANKTEDKAEDNGLNLGLIIGIAAAAVAVIAVAAVVLAKKKKN